MSSSRFWCVFPLTTAEPAEYSCSLTSYFPKTRKKQSLDTYSTYLPKLEGKVPKAPDVGKRPGRQPNVTGPCLAAVQRRICPFLAQSCSQANPAAPEVSADQRLDYGTKRESHWRRRRVAFGEDGLKRKAIDKNSEACQGRGPNLFRRRLIGGFDTTARATRQG